jgi:hypothetical protein
MRDSRLLVTWEELAVHPVVGLPLVRQRALLPSALQIEAPCACVVLNQECWASGATTANMAHVSRKPEAFYTPVRMETDRDTWDGCALWLQVGGALKLRAPPSHESHRVVPLGQQVPVLAAEAWLGGGPRATQAKAALACTGSVGVNALLKTQFGGEQVTCHQDWLTSAMATDQPLTASEGVPIPVSAARDTLLSATARRTRQGQRDYIRAIDAEGRRVDMLVKRCDNLLRDAVFQLMLHEWNRCAADLYTDQLPTAPTYGVVPRGTTGGLVVLLQNSPTLFTLVEDAPAAPHAALTVNFKTFRKLASDSPRNVLQQRLRSTVASCWEWYRGTRALVSSAAAGSVIGATVGLGDRHLGNILLHSNFTLVHIDQQVLFGSGVRLLVPETVPCRFTPIIRDCAGASPRLFQHEFQRWLGVAQHTAPLLPLLWEAFGEASSDTLRQAEARRAQPETVPAWWAGVLEEAMRESNLAKLHTSWTAWI